MVDQKANLYSVMKCGTVSVNEDSKIVIEKNVRKHKRCSRGKNRKSMWNSTEQIDVHISMRSIGQVSSGEQLNINDKTEVQTNPFPVNENNSLKDKEKRGTNY